MTSRNAYTALTPDAADFAVPHSPGAMTFPPSDLVPGQNQTLCRSTFSRAQEVIRNNTGLLLVAASQAFFSLMNVAVKKLNSLDPPVSTLELVFVRMGITYICCMTYMLSQKVPDPWTGPKGVRALLVFRGFTGFFGLFGIYYSLQYLSLSDATVLTFLAPLFTAIAGSFILKENFTRKEALAGIFSLFGVVLIARPEFLFGAASKVAAEISPIGDGIEPPMDVAEKGTPAERLVAVGVAMVGVFGATGAYTTLRAIGKRAHPLHALTSFSAQCVLASAIAMIATRAPFVIPTRLDWLVLLVMIGIFGFIAQVLLTMGLQRETAGRGTIAVYTQVIFASILERIFFHSTPSVLSVFGTLIIMTSALYVAVTKEKESSSKGSSVSLDRVEEAALEEGLLDHMEDLGKAQGGRFEPSDARRAPALPKRAPTPYVVDSSLGDIELAEVKDDGPDNIKPQK